MNKETYEALKRVIKKSKAYLVVKYGHRKRLTQDELWEKATLIRDMKQLEDWIDEVAKGYID